MRWKKYIIDILLFMVLVLLFCVYLLMWLGNSDFSSKDLSIQWMMIFLFLLPMNLFYPNRWFGLIFLAGIFFTLFLFLPPEIGWQMRSWIQKPFALILPNRFLHHDAIFSLPQDSFFSKWFVYLHREIGQWSFWTESKIPPYLRIIFWSLLLSYARRDENYAQVLFGRIGLILSVFMLTYLVQSYLSSWTKIQEMMPLLFLGFFWLLPQKRRSL